MQRLCGTFLLNYQITSCDLALRKRVGDESSMNTVFSAVTKNEIYKLAHLASELQQKIESFFERPHGTNNGMVGKYELEMRKICSAIEFYEVDIAEHSISVFWLSLKIGEMMKISEREMEKLAWGSFFHDIGKVAVPQSILLKKGKLTNEEFSVIKKHPQYGFEVVNNIQHLSETADIVLHHHERYDGTGYPFGLKGEKIALLARICSAADAFEAMLCDRPYQKRMSVSQAISELRRCSGTQFDPEVISCLYDIGRGMRNVRTADSTIPFRIGGV